MLQFLSWPVYQENKVENLIKKAECKTCRTKNYRNRSMYTCVYWKRINLCKSVLHQLNYIIWMNYNSNKWMVFKSNCIVLHSNIVHNFVYLLHVCARHIFILFIFSTTNNYWATKTTFCRHPHIKYQFLVNLNMLNPNM